MKKRFSIYCMGFALVLMALPSVKMTFMADIDEPLTKYYSYFSPISIGGGNWLTTLTAFFSIVVLVLLLTEDILSPLIKDKKYVAEIKKILLAICVVLSPSSWIIADTISILGIIIWLLHICAVALQVL